VASVEKYDGFAAGQLFQQVERFGENGKLNLLRRLGSKQFHGFPSGTVVAMRAAGCQDAHGMNACHVPILPMLPGRIAFSSLKGNFEKFQGLKANEMSWKLVANPLRTCADWLAGPKPVCQGADLDAV
jgi:hypothetical protein